MPQSGYYGGNFRTGVGSLAADSTTSYMSYVTTKDLERFKPCPVCYSPMPKGECAKHGAPK